MKRYLLIWTHLILSLALLIGCAEKENKDVIKTRLAILHGDYAKAESVIKKIRANDSENREAQHLERFLQLRENTETSSWHEAIAQTLSHLETLNTDIQTISMQEDPDSDELDRQERLIRSRNSILGLFAVALATAVDKRTELLTDLAKHAEPVVVTALLEAQKCYQPAARAAAEQLLQHLTRGEPSLLAGDEEAQSATLNALRRIATAHTDAQIRKAAIHHLGALETHELIPTYQAILTKTDDAPEVAYTAIVAVGRLCKPEFQHLVGQRADLISLLQLAARNNNAQVRMHAAKLLGKLQAAEAVDDLIKLLADSNGYVKDIAIDTLNRIGTPAVASLLKVLETGAHNIIPDEDAGLSEQYRYIASAYIDDSWMKKYRRGTQVAAITALGTLRAEEAVLPLIRVLADEDLKGAALTALISMQGVAVPSLLEALETPEHIVRRVENSDTRHQVQLEAANALSAIGDRRAIPAFIAILTGDAHKELKVIAAKGLGNMRARGQNNSAVMALTAALDFDDTTVTQAAEALGKINAPTDETIRKLIAISMDKQRRETVRLAAINALWELNPANATQPMLLLLLSDETGAVIRAEATKVLSRIKAPETLPVLFWVLSMRFDEISDFQRHMKRQYKNLETLRTQLDSLNVEWTADYPRPYYRIWGELKPVPSLVRSEVARTLGIIKGETVVEPLAAALADDQRATVRRAAAWGLGTVGGADVIDPLLTALKKDKQGVVRQEAAIALGKIKSEKSANALLDILQTDKYETARLEATKALREINPALVDKALVDIVKKGLGSFEDGYEVISVQNEVIGALIKNGNATTTGFLLDALRSANDEWTRWALVYMIGVIHNKSALTTMLNEMQHPSYIVRKQAVASIGGFKDRQTVEPLIAILKNREETKSIRAAATSSLGALRDERAAPALREALMDENSAVRYQAVIALGGIKDTAAVSKLSEMVENELEVDAVRAAAVTALGNIGDKTAEPVLLRALDLQVGTIAKNAMIALGRLKSTRAVPQLIAILEDKRVPLNASTYLLAVASARIKAALALGEIGGPAAANAIAKQLIDDTEYIVALEDEWNRRAVGLDALKRNWSWELFVTASSKLKLPEHIAEKMAAREADEWEDSAVRNAAAVALGRSRPLNVSQLKAALADPDEGVRKSTARKIGQTNMLPLAADLIPIANGETEDTKDVRRLATQALGDLADVATTDALIDVMNTDENHIEIRRDAARALGKIGTDTAVSAIVAKLSELHEEQTSRAFRLALIWALGEAKNSNGTQLLEKILQDTDADIHFQAASALFEITGNGYGYNRI